MRRRTMVRGLATGTAVGLAGCITRNDDDEPNGEEPIDPDGEDEGTLRVATYSSLLAGEQSAGEWLAEAFEDAYPDATLEWVVPESGIDHYVQRARYHAEIDVDVFLGVTVDQLVRIDTTLASRLFGSLERGRLEHAGRVRDDLAFEEPHDRAIPFGTGYVSLVYDERDLETPATFADLLEDAYEDALLTQDPRYSRPGRAFLLWTIAAYGEDYLEFWRSLAANGVEIRDRWSDAYLGDYLEGERPMVVSYSTDRVGAITADRNLDRHQVATLEESGYRTTEAIAIFEATTKRELAYQFVDFVLSREIQAELATRNVQFPAVTDEYVDLEGQFEMAAVEPEESVAFDYEELYDDLGNWLVEWEATIID
ncbi:thiamine ABC transporter substrate-binding protein [Salinadaptatus halalkaliphilus]|uniref:Thiamine ABC transporter substrate-binding protein n=1 Tax=Salinadaptatus halalkaliphilus TaxID=2419781 RepID=A0A4V3VLI4_9EURY|nr:thiamine ABC transporter substrate-binding protein [Salinadaptatus halalkaliphilus]THE65797.1 thiamine ABC transporter substrate-binding protein [Salinadaptatus halalkaliphilus]